MFKHISPSVDFDLEYTVNFALYDNANLKYKDSIRLMNSCLFSFLFWSVLSIWRNSKPRAFAPLSVTIERCKFS